MATCPRCSNEFDPENETQPYCECGYSYIEDHSDDDRPKDVEEDATEYYDQMFKKAEEENLLIDKEIEILKTILLILKDIPAYSKTKILDLIADISNLNEFETQPYNAVLFALNALPVKTHQKLIDLAKDFYGLEKKTKDEDIQF